MQYVPNQLAGSLTLTNVWLADIMQIIEFVITVILSTWPNRLKTHSNNFLPIEKHLEAGRIAQSK